MDYTAAVAALHRGIAKLVTKFQQHPFNYLYETDLQALLFSALVTEFENHPITMQGGYRDAAEYGESNNVVTIPVKCEYPSNQRFDIAIIDRTSVRTYDKVHWQAKKLKSDAFWDQPVMAAIELKYCQLGYKSRTVKQGCDRDIRKLTDYLQGERGGRQFLGISLLFIQSGQVPQEFFEGKKLESDLSEGIGRYVVSRNQYDRFYVDHSLPEIAVPPTEGADNTKPTKV